MTLEKRTFQRSNVLVTNSCVCLSALVVGYALFSSFLLGYFAASGTRTRTIDDLANALNSMSFQTIGSDNKKHPILQMVRSFPIGKQHDPRQKRSCLALTAVVSEMEKLEKAVQRVLAFGPYKSFDCIHINIPDRPMRYQNDNTLNNKPVEVKEYPSTQQLLSVYANHSRVIIHRLFDYGPMTRYIGPIAYEQHPESSIVIFDIDSGEKMFQPDFNLTSLVQAANELDRDAMWCYQGENFFVDDRAGKTKENWDLFPLVPGNSSVGDWNFAHFCRGVSGLLFKPKHFNNFFWNQSDYHESCFWDDDRWVSYQLERQKFPIKVLHPNVSMMTTKLDSENNRDEANDKPSLSRRRLGTLTAVNRELGSSVNCPLAWFKFHPDVYPSARVSFSAGDTKLSQQNKRQRRKKTAA